MVRTAAGGELTSRGAQFSISAARLVATRNPGTIVLRMMFSISYNLGGLWQPAQVAHRWMSFVPPLVLVGGSYRQVPTSPGVPVKLAVSLPPHAS